MIALHDKAGETAGQIPREAMECVLLTLIFSGLKLSGYIGWSWEWVLSPLWIMLLAAIATFAFVVACIALAVWLHD
jgi:hypothetical protein